MNNARDIALIDELLDNRQENECLEFKENNTNPKIMGKLCSALSNSARIYNQDFSYVLWGVNDAGKIVGTDFNPDKSTDKSIPKFKLAQKLKPKIDCDFKAVNHSKGRVVMLKIPATTMAPVEFDGTAYVRVGSATPKLSDHSNKMQDLIKNLHTYTWENEVAKQFLSISAVFEYLNYPIYFKLTDQKVPKNEQEILKYLEKDGLIAKDVADKWNILNLGALLLAKNLNDFGVSLARKGVRFVAYAGRHKATNIIKRIDGEKGYAMALEGLLTFINDFLPASEVIGEVYREKHEAFPKIAIREIIANALIHQDMTITGAGPLVELFNNRLEVSNPGESLNCSDRMIDLPPKSRNEKLAGLMRRMRLCEELGSGIDKVIDSVEKALLPAPNFTADEGSTWVVLYAYRAFADLTIEERARACYQHAVIKYINGEKLKNAGLCARFGIKKGNESQVSKVIKNARLKGLIKVADKESPRSGYYPHWA